MMYKLMRKLSKIYSNITDKFVENTRYDCHMVDDDNAVLSLFSPTSPIQHRIKSQKRSSRQRYNPLFVLCAERQSDYLRVFTCMNTDEPCFEPAAIVGSTHRSRLGNAFVSHELSLPHTVCRVS